MKIKVRWIIDGVMTVDATSNEEAEAKVDAKLGEFIASNSEMTEVFGAEAIQGHVIIDDEEG
jgi:hypothetical protein